MKFSYEDVDKSVSLKHDGTDGSIGTDKYGFEGGRVLTGGAIGADGTGN